MRVLLINPELPLSFWSLRETCKFLGRKTLLPPLGLLTVAALLPQEWEFRLADLNTGPLLAADWHWADLVLLSGMIIQKQEILDLIRRAKQQGKTTVVGGPYATALPREVLEAEPDFLVRGEGEVTIPYFLAALGAGKTAGIFEEDKKPAMTTSPVPRFDLLNFGHYVTMGIQTSRGCPFNCEFCDIVSLFGRVPRYKTPDQVLREVQALYRMGWEREVFLCDDNFIGNKNHARAILGRLTAWNQRRGEPFAYWTQTSVNLGEDLEMIDLLTAANFNHVFLGVETPEIEILNRNRKYQNVKSPLGKSLANINANGLSMVASFVLGFDHESPGAGARIRQFVEEHSIPIVMLNLLQALPNTDLWDRLKQEGRLLEVQPSGDSFTLGFNFVPTRPPEEILEEYVRAIDGIYEPSGYLSRAYRYFLKMRPTRRALGARDGGTAGGTPTAAGSSSALIKVKDLQGLLAFFWRQGGRPRYRLQFWRQLVGIYLKNPSRLKSYLACCAMGENLFQLRREILRKRAEAHAARRP